MLSAPAPNSGQPDPPLGVKNCSSVPPHAPVSEARDLLLHDGSDVLAPPMHFAAAVSLIAGAGTGP